MDRWFQEFKTTIVNYKLDFCCWLLPLRVGCLVTACFNIISDFICMVGIANDGFSPTIIKVQDALIEDYVTKPPTLLAYTMELAMNVVFLCAICRKDVILLRVFMYYSLIALALSFLVYSIIIAAVPLELAIVIIIGPLYQAYTIILVRSYIVEVKLQSSKYQLPTVITMSSLQNKESQIVTNDKDHQNGKPEDTQEIKVFIPETTRKDNNELIININKTPDISPTTEVKDQAKKKEDNVKNEKIEKRVIEFKKVEKKNDADKKISKEIIKNDKEETKNTAKVKEEPTDDKSKEENKHDKQVEEGKEKQETPKKKPREIRSVQSIFSRRKKVKATEAEKANPETTDQKDSKDTKLATVNEHPKE